MIIDGEIVSAAAICNKLPEAGIVCDVYTKPEFRGRGYAKAVTSATTRRIVETDAVALLYVEIGNEPAIKVYTELGYKITRTLPWVAAHP
jgi:predicted GNAT family acetyltransferase